MAPGRYRYRMPDMVKRTRIKICGITRLADAVAAAEAGADAIGCVFWKRSSRAVSPEQAAEFARTLGPFVSLVGLFVDPDPDYVRSVCEMVPIDCLQFHGNEGASFCESFQMRWIKALHVRADADLMRLMRQYDNAQGILLDNYDPVRVGGTGSSFDWSLIPDKSHRPLILAGGLSTENVASALRRVQPWAVDVSTGVESAPGLKDAAKIRAFVEAVRSA